MKSDFFKSLLGVAVVAIVAICHLSSSAQTFVYGNNEYTVTSTTDKVVSLTKAVSGESGQLIIPSKIEYNGEQYTVTEIGHDACKDSGGKWTLIPWTVKKIGRYALQGLSGTLIFQEPPTSEPSSSLTINVNVLQFGNYFQAYFGSDQKAAPAPVFHRLYFGRAFNFYADNEDGIPDEDLNAFFLLVSQSQLDEVIVGSQITNIDNLLGYNSEYGCGSYSAIKRLYIYNSDHVLDFPYNLLRGYSEKYFYPTAYTTVYVPAEMTDAYMAASGWKNFQLTEFTPKSGDCYDLDSDGVVNVADVSTLYLGMLLTESDDLKIDLNTDGYINAGDISEFYKILVNGDSRWWVNFITNKGIIFTDENDIMYQTIDENEVAVIRFPQEAKSVAIPDRVENDNVTYSVTRIAQYAANDFVESLVLPATIDSIEPYGLAYCRSLKSLSFMGDDNAKPLRIGPNQFHEIYKDTYTSGEMLHCCYPYVNNDDAHDHLQLKYLYLDRDIQRNTTEISNPYARQLLFHQIDMDKIVIGEHVTDIRNAFGHGGNGCAAIRVKDIEVLSINPPETWEIVREFRTDNCTFFEGNYMYGKGEGHPKDTYYSNYKSATLHVRDNAIEKYKTISPWNKFENIKSIADDPEKLTFTDVNGFTYQAIGENEAAVIHFPQNAKDVVIPEQVTHNDVLYTVTRISRYAGNHVVERLIIPAVIDSIEPHGLADCFALSNLSFIGADDAKPLKIGPNQFHEIINGSEMEDCRFPHVDINSSHDHLQLKNLYLDRDIQRNDAAFTDKQKSQLLFHQIDMDRIVIGEHVTDISQAFGHGGDGCAAIKVKDIEVHAPQPPATMMNDNSDNFTFFDGNFNYGTDSDNPSQAYYSNYKTAILHLPETITDKYMATAPWNNFANVVNIDEGLPTFSDENMIQYKAIDDKHVKVIKFPEEATVEIPEQVVNDNQTYTVKRIAKNASNDVVERLVIPATVDSIENNGLAYSINLKDLVFLGDEDAAPLRIGVNQFHELNEGNRWEFSNCGPNVSHQDSHDHLQLKNLYLDRDIVRNDNGAGVLISHQIDMEKIVIGEHVNNITSAFGYMFSDLDGGVSAIRVNIIELRAAVPPIASESSEKTQQFFDGEFQYNRKYDKTKYIFTYETGYYSNYQSTRLIIPQGTAEAYSAAFPWNKFTIVEESE